MALHRQLGIIAKHIMEGLGQNRSAGALILVTAKSVLNRDHMDAGQSKQKDCRGINHAHGDDYYSPARRNTRCSVVYLETFGKGPHFHKATALTGRITRGDLGVRTVSFQSSMLQ